MNIGELFDRLTVLAQLEPSVTNSRRLYETLMLACNEATKDEGTGFGNLFSQVDYLCKRCRVRKSDRIALQQMRYRTHHAIVPEREQWLDDIRALAVFVSAVWAIDIPSSLTVLLPHEPLSRGMSVGQTWKYVRCIVQRWDSRYIYATTNDGEVTIDYGEQEDGTDHGYMGKLLREHMQLNLLDVHLAPHTSHLIPRLIVVEPDFLVDISALAALFTDYGHHPLLYTVGRLQPRANSQAILLGNFAGAALDDIINKEDFAIANTMKESFREQALQFCTCPDFSPTTFKADAMEQVKNLQEVVGVLFPEDGGQAANDRSKAILEPSFVCERLGLQGRVDLMTTDMHLLVEQKSGKLWGRPLRYKEQHYVQLLLYYGVLRYNFGVGDTQIDMRLLYSHYPAQEGLMVVNFYQALFREAIALRNQVVAQEFAIARDGFESVIPHLNIDTVYAPYTEQPTTFFTRYIAPRVNYLQDQLGRLSSEEREYLERQMTFVYREQLYNKLGSQKGVGNAASDLWNMPLEEKRETGSILTDMRIVEMEQSVDGCGYDLLTLVPEELVVADDEVTTSFRRGDMVYLYAYQGEPDVRKSLLFRGRLMEIQSRKVVVKLNDAQQNTHVFSAICAGQQSVRYAIENDTSDIGTNSAIRSLMAFITSSPQKRQLLLGQRAPQVDPTATLSRSYHPNYDNILLKEKQARDYFLLIGPPGTGKTSMALRYMVEEELCTEGSSLLLMSYTNRAVDEICAMLVEAGISFLRLGNESSCDPRFRPYLLDMVLGDKPKLSDIQQYIRQVRVVVSTTATMQTRPFIFQLKHFSLCVVDEASQILEPNIIGLLASDAVGRFVLIGDYKQLPAVVQQPGHHVSLFERLIRQERQQGRQQLIGILRKQGRMHPDIAAFPNELFYQREQLEPVPLPHQEDTTMHYDQPSEDKLDDLLKLRRVIFMDSGSHQANSSSDKVNAAEAHIVADLLRRIYRQYGAARFDSDKTVGVIVPYRNQISMIRHEIEKLDIPVLQQISIDTVERYQGSQRDVIIYSFTVQHRYQLDFLTSNSFEEDGCVIDRKFNVALTRARKQLLITGCATVLKHNPLFREFIRRYAI